MTYGLIWFCDFDGWAGSFTIRISARPLFQLDLNQFTGNSVLCYRYADCKKPKEELFPERLVSYMYLSTIYMYRAMKQSFVNGKIKHPNQSAKP